MNLHCTLSCAITSFIYLGDRNGNAVLQLKSDLGFIKLEHYHSTSDWNTPTNEVRYPVCLPNHIVHLQYHHQGSMACVPRPLSSSILPKILSHGVCSSLISALKVHHLTLSRLKFMSFFSPFHQNINIRSRLLTNFVNVHVIRELTDRASCVTFKSFTYIAINNGSSTEQCGTH